MTGLVDEATFARTAPAELCVPEQPHQHQVNRMSHELQLTLTLSLSLTLTLTLTLSLTLTLTVTLTR